MPFKNPALADAKEVVRSFTISHQLSGTLPATSANYQRFWTAPAKCVIDSVVASWATASSSGTLQIEKVPSGTAQASGTNLLTSTISTAGAADTNNSGTLSATAATLELAAGDSLALVDGGTLTSLVSLTVTTGAHWIA